MRGRLAFDRPNGNRPYRIGVARAKRLYATLNIESLPDLLMAARR